MFLHGVVLSAFPGTLTRISVGLTISAGAATAVGPAAFFELLESQEEPSGTRGQLWGRS
jgi:hypothetical protein